MTVSTVVLVEMIDQFVQLFYFVSILACID